MISSSTERSRTLLRFVVRVLFLFLAATLSGHVPVPAGVLDPKTPAEAWNVLRLATANVERLLRENRLSEVPDQISLCSPALRRLPKWVADQPGNGQRVAEGIVRASVLVGSLAQAAVAGDRMMAKTTFGSLRDALAKLAVNFDPRVVAADIYFCPMHPDFVSADAAAHCDKCGMSLLTRRIPYSFIYVPPGEPAFHLTASADGDPTQGKPLKVTVRLARHDGTPVLLTDLVVMHTQPIHLLIVDPMLEDYHHEHPSPTGVPGEYAFTFTPAKSTNYRIFADVVPVDTGVQEYPFTDLPSRGSPTLTRTQQAGSMTARIEGITFHLDYGQTDGSPPRAGQVRALQVAITGSDGKPMTVLEPVMNAFAHLVGFYDDYRTVVHLHPEGSEITDPNARGGPVLDFKFYPPQAGFVRLYCQVQVGGRMIFAPFNVNVSP